MFIITCN